MTTDRLQSELDNILPADFDRETVIKTDLLDVYELLVHRTGKATRTVEKWLDDLPSGALLCWRPPRRPWLVFVPVSEVEGMEFEYRMRFGEWMVVGLEKWLGANSSTKEKV